MFYTVRTLSIILIGVNVLLVKVSSEMDRVFTEMATDFNYEIAVNESAFETRKKSFYPLK